ncbi:hypothetical protein Tco_0613970 [Tanacetum coccineum]
MQTPIPSPSRSPRTDLSSDKTISQELMATDIEERVDKVLHDIVPKIASNATNDLIADNHPRVVADAVKKEREASKATIPALISKEFADHAPKLIEELFKIHMKNNVINVHLTTSTSTATTTTADLQHQLYLKMKSNLHDQVLDPELWDVLKRKFEKSSASTSSYRDDAFHKRNHDEHQGDDGSLEGEKSAKRQKTSKGSKYARGSSSKQPVQRSKTSTSEHQQQQEWDAWVEDIVIDE